MKLEQSRIRNSLAVICVDKLLYITMNSKALRNKQPIIDLDEEED